LKLTELPQINPQLPTFVSTDTWTPSWNITYSYEIKFDGICCILYWTREDGVYLQSRTEKRLTNINVWFTGALHKYFTEATKFQAVTLHGELIAVDKDHPGGNLPALQLRKASKCILQYRVFDFLFANNKDLRQLPYRNRRAYLEKYFTAKSPFIKLVPAKPRIEDLPKWPELEGYVAKNVHSLYLGDRQRSWLKIKPRQGKDFICIGWNPGQGRRYGTVGSLKLGELVDGEVKYVGDVGTGLNDNQLDVLNQWIQDHCQEDWQPFMVECTYARRTTEGRLWHPSVLKFIFPGE